MLKSVLNWFTGMAKVFRGEFSLIRHDEGALLFFIGLPLMYPLIYTLIYNPEVVTSLPVAVVDNDRSTMSRQIVRDLSATPAIEIAGYASDVEEAKRWMAQGDAAAVMMVPADFSDKVATGRQADISFYYDTQLLLKYRALLSAVTDYQIDLTSRITMRKVEELGASSLVTGMPVKSEANFMGDTQQGFASFVIPGIVILILQQSMVLGITLLGGTSRERRRRNRGYDPLMPAGVTAAQSLWGKTICYMLLYIPAAFYVMHFVPWFFDLPHFGSIFDSMMFIIPMLTASTMLAQALTYFCKERESCFLVIVFTSVLFLFLSGLTWPRYAITGIWKWLGDMVPATWGIEGFIRINSNNASLAENIKPFLWMWVLTFAYFFLAWGVTAILNRKEGYWPRSR